MTTVLVIVAVVCRSSCLWFSGLLELTGLLMRSVM